MFTLRLFFLLSASYVNLELEYRKIWSWDQDLVTLKGSIPDNLCEQKPAQMHGKSDDVSSHVAIFQREEEEEEEGVGLYRDKDSKKNNRCK